MISAIRTAPSTGATTASTATSGRTLVADLARAEVKLSDWSHCVSAATPEGKEKIAQYSAQVDDIKAQMKKAQDARDATRDTTATPPAATDRLLDVYA